MAESARGRRLATPSLDRSFEALADEYRRAILVELLRRPPGEELSIPAVLAEAGRDAGEAATELRHTHLPKLEAFGYVGWDPANRLVQRGPRFEEIQPLLAAFEDVEDRIEAWP